MAWKALTKPGEARARLTKIVQGPQEPFSDFVARITEAAERIFGDSDQAAPLVEQLIFEQATQECRAAITPRRHKGLSDWLRVCRDLGGPLTNAGLAAAIIQSQSRRPNNNVIKTCFGCGKPGHFKRDCTAWEAKKQALKICPRCGKGYHRPELFRSVKDIKGRPLPPHSTFANDDSKNGREGPWSQGPQEYGNPRAQSKNRETIPENPQGWICVPPPTSY